MQMLRWQDFLEKENVVCGMSASSKSEVIEKLVGVLVESGCVSDGPDFMSNVISREELGSTGIGERIAMPHGKSKSVARMSVAFARLSKPVDFESSDRVPVEYVFMIAAPANQDSLYIGVMASVIRSIKLGGLLEMLGALEGRDEIFEALNGKSIKLSR